MTSTASAAATQMEIVSATPAEGTITVTWKPFTAANLTGFVVTIVDQYNSLENFVQTSKTATSLDCPYTMVEGQTYQALVGPLIFNAPNAAMTSPPVPIPYPPTGEKR
jgi:hypothetical protein